jgi:hypothetical protein
MVIAMAMSQQIMIASSRHAVNNTERISAMTRGKPVVVHLM